MFDFSMISVWGELIIRWLHVVAGIAWIGSSFYFIALDLGLKRHRNLPADAFGDAWQVHGGGFYHLVKYMVSPTNLPEELTWFKWEAYTTWISGFILFVLVYYLGADFYLIDHSVASMTHAEAISVSLIGIVISWLVYNFLCGLNTRDNSYYLLVIGLILLVGLSFAFANTLSARGAFMQMGVIMGSLMVGNVLLVIIPNQKKVVRALKLGEKPNPIFGVIGKQRSTHNNYLTLPVVYVMIGSHYPMAYATDYAWVMLGLVIVAGALIRHFFNQKHMGNKPPIWAICVATATMVTVISLSIVGSYRYPQLSVAEEKRVVEKVGAALVDTSHSIILTRCSLCHARDPLWPDLTSPPKGVVLETKSDLFIHHRAVYWHAVRSKSMPPANLTGLTSQEREVLAVFNYEMSK